MPKRQRWNYKGIEKYRKWFSGQKPVTTNKTARKLKEFCEWIDKTPEQLLEEYKQATDKKAWQRDRRKEIQAFYSHLVSKGYKINTARTKPLGFLSFYSRHAETIRDATKVFDAPQIPEDEFVFTQDITFLGQMLQTKR